jgi:hypothetical protein
MAIILYLKIAQIFVKIIIGILFTVLRKETVIKNCYKKIAAENLMSDSL